MKLLALLSTILFGVMPLAGAEPNPVPQPPTLSLVKDPNINTDGSVRLSAGTLGDIVAEIERLIQRWPQKREGKDWVMPNILYANDTRDAEIPGALTLREVSPLQAITLAAAAAGCTLESIFSPAEEAGETGSLGTGSKPLPIIGYRIVPTRTSGPSAAGVPASAWIRQPAVLEGTGAVELLRERIPSGLNFTAQPLPAAGGAVEAPVTGIGIALAKKDGGIVVGQVVPGSPASLFPAIQPGSRIVSVAEAGKTAVDVTGLELEKVVELIRGQPGTPVTIAFLSDSGNGPVLHTAELVRAKLSLSSPVATLPAAKSVTPNAPGVGNRFVFTRETTPGLVTIVNPAANTLEDRGPFVRVYALGNILSDGKGEDARRCEELIVVALRTADPSSKTQPDLAFHVGVRALIVKATAAQHEIVEQVIQVLKENATVQEQQALKQTGR